MMDVRELMTDSVADPPRDEIPPEEYNPDRNGNNGSGAQENVKMRDQEKSPPIPEKRHSSDSKPKLQPQPQPQPSFNIPNLRTPGGTSVICINNAGNVQLGNNVNLNIIGHKYSHPHPSKKSPEPEPHKMEKSKKVKEACKRTTSVTNEDLDKVTEHVGKRWMKLGERIGFKVEQMERFHEDHHQMGLREVVYQMLLDWKQNKGPDAHVGILCHCLWSARLYNAAEELAAQYSLKSL